MAANRADQLESVTGRVKLRLFQQDKETKEILHGSVITIYKYHNILYKDIQYQTVTLPGSYSADFDITAFEPADWYIPGDTGTVESIATFEIEDDIDIYDVPDLENGKYVIVEEYTRVAEEKLINIVKERVASSNISEIKLRDYQEEAIHAWIENHYNGFFVMATGTGKTWTAIYAARELVKVDSSMIVICAPYKHLVKQWSEDVRIAFPDARIILVSSENPGWDRQITNEIIHCKYQKNIQIIVISTITSFNMKRFDDTIKKFDGNRLLIVDEAHRFNIHPDELHNTYKYMLGLSATPFSGKSAIKGNELMNFFGGQVFNLPI